MAILDRDFRVLNRDDPIVPIVRNRAPIIERIRERRNNSDNLANELGNLAGEIVKSDSRVDKQNTRDELIEGMRKSLAKELGVSEDDINVTTLEDIADQITSLDESQVLKQSAIDELNIQLDDEVIEEEAETTVEDDREESEVENGGVSGESGEVRSGETEGTETETDLFDEE